MLFVYFFGALLCGMIASAIANAKYRSGCLFFFLGFIIGPFAILGAAIMSRDNQGATRHALDRGDLLRCPACREPIQPLATICPYCRTAVKPIPVDDDPGMLETLGGFIAQIWRR